MRVLDCYFLLFLLPRFFYAVVCDWIEHVQKFNIFNTLWNLINRLASVQRRNKIRIYIEAYTTTYYIHTIYYIICYFFIISKFFSLFPSLSCLCAVWCCTKCLVMSKSETEDGKTQNKLNKKYFKTSVFILLSLVKNSGFIEDEKERIKKESTSDNREKPTSQYYTT